MKKILLALMPVFACFTYVSQVNAQTKTINSDLDISQDTVWEDVVVIDGAKVTVEQNATLTIRPGTLVVGKNNAFINVFGKLKALGEKDKKVKFTDDIDQEPNTDLAYHIDSTYSSEISLENYILEKGGGNHDTGSLPALTIRGKASLSRGIIRRNFITGVRVWSTDVKIEDSEIYENESVAVENKSTTSTLNAEDNWWGSEEGPTATAIPNSPRAVVKGLVDSDPWQDKGPIPVVILPGIGGSFSFKLLSEKAKNDWWLTPVGTAAYRYFAKALILSNYYHNKDFFWGFYDWRMPCEESAEKYLEQIIDEAKEKSGHFQVHIVAHSMGGLVARSYIQGEDFRDDVDRFVAAGTPHLGSSDVYPIWEGGKFLDEKMPVYLYLWYLEALDWDWKKIGFIRKNFPSFGEMMPVYDYLVKNSNNQLINYKDQKEQNVFLENLAKIENIAKLKRRVTAGLIVGNNKETLEKIKVSPFEGEEDEWADGIPDPLSPPKDTENGDGTVTIKSASADDQITKNVSVLSNAKHGELLEIGTKAIFDQLKIKAKFPLLFKIMSRFLLTAKGPVDISIEGEPGKFVSAAKQEIDDSQYYTENIDGQKLIFSDFPVEDEVDSGKSVKVTLAGLEKGDFRIAFWHLSPNEDYEKKEITGSIDKGMGITYEVVLSENEEHAPTLSIVNKKFANLLRIKHPQPNEKYLNWQKISPEAEIWQSVDGRVSDVAVSYKIDGESVGNTVDLGNWSIGEHSFKSVADYQIDSTAQNEEAEINFSVDTSLKSLVTLINRNYKENKIIDWKVRSKLINLIAQAYQDACNEKVSKAQETIKKTESILRSFDDNLIDNNTMDRLAESLAVLESKPR